MFRNEHSIKIRSGNLYVPYICIQIKNNISFKYILNFFSFFILKHEAEEKF